MGILILPQKGLWKPSLGAQIDWGHPLTKGLVFCALMNEGGGMFCNNLASTFYRGTLTNMTPADWIPTIKGLGLKWDQSTSYIPLNAGAIVANLNNSTVEALVIPTTTTGESSIYDESDTTSQTVFRTRRYSNVFGFDFVITSTWYNCTGSTTITSGNPYHVAGTFSTNLGMKLYVNSKLDGTNANTTPCNKSIGNSWIGRYGQTGYNWIGNIIFVRLWARTLSQNEIEWLYTDPYCFIT